MKKKIILVVLFILGLTLGMLVAVVKNDKTSKELELTYETNGGVPYKWEYIIEDDDIVQFVKKYEIENKNKNGKVGAPIKYKYIFKGLKEGKTTITFNYINLTTGNITKMQKYKVKVDKNKNISLIDLTYDDKEKK